MPQLAPPSPPESTLLTFDDGLRRVHFRLWQILMAGITVVLTAWFMTFGVWPAILALLVAKHVLVAIVAAGLNCAEHRRFSRATVAQIGNLPDPPRNG